jgi:hypothetical protein
VKPPFASATTSAGQLASFSPILKKVARTLKDWRIWRIAAVDAPGPSSKVRATVRPPPGAAYWAPTRGVGQEVVAVETGAAEAEPELTVRRAPRRVRRSTPRVTRHVLD